MQAQNLVRIKVWRGATLKLEVLHSNMAQITMSTNDLCHLPEPSLCYYGELLGLQRSKGQNLLGVPSRLAGTQLP